MRALLIALFVLAPAPARADAADRSDPGRLLHATPFVVGGSIYLLLELGIKDAITPDHCRWCKANALDAATRDRFLWRDASDADRFSNYTGYFGNPTVAIGLLLVSSASGDTELRTIYDDVIPCSRPAW